MFLKAQENTRRRLDGGVRGGAKSFGAFDALLDLPHAAEILVQFLFVAGGELPLELARVVQDEIQNGPLLLLPAQQTLRSFTGRSGAKEPFEEQARIRLG